MRTKKKITAAVKWLFLTALVLVELIPILQVYLNSFRTNADVKGRPFGLPAEWVFANWPKTWRLGGYTRAFFNSIVIAAVVIVVTLCLISLCAYALSKMEFKGKGLVTGYFFVAISLPGFLYIVPDYFMFNKIGLVNNPVGLILLYIAMQIPFNMLLLRTFLTDIPRELEEAGKVDGCGDFDVFFRIIMPIAKPMVFTIVILIFVNVWNEFLWANTFIADENMKTLATRFVKFVGEHASDMASIYTASAITITPIIVIYLLFSRRFIEGMTSGSVKG